MLSFFVWYFSFYLCISVPEEFFSPSVLVFLHSLLFFHYVLVSPRTLLYSIHYVLVSSQILLYYIYFWFLFRSCRSFVSFGVANVSGAVFPIVMYALNSYSLWFPSVFGVPFLSDVILLILVYRRFLMLSVHKFCFLPDPAIIFQFFGVSNFSDATFTYSVVFISLKCAASFRFPYVLVSAQFLI